MKKSLCLFVFSLLLVSWVMAADSTSTAVWQITSETAGQNFIKNDHATRSMALNKTTDHLLVATRSGGHRIVVLDAATGDSLAQLDMTGVLGGTYHLNKVAVADDGVIYACNLDIGNGVKVYRWENEEAAPTVCIETQVEGATRFGDAFAVMGAGTDTKIYISGNNDASRVTILGTENGTDFTVEHMVPQNGRATDIYPLDESTFFKTYPGAATALLDTSGTALETITTDVIASGASSIHQLVSATTSEYLAVFDGNNVPATARLVSLDEGAAAAEVALVFSNLGNNGNANGTGAVAVDPTINRVYFLATNNSISAFNYGPYDTWPLVHRILADTTDWFGTSHMVRTVTYSHATDHLYVVSRIGGSFIKVFDATTGAYLKDLDNTGISGGTYHINLAAATKDGQIFVGNLALPNVPFKLYRLANEEAAPELVFEGVLEGRTGDALAVSGTGDQVTVYVSGPNNEKIFTLVPDDSAGFVRDDDILLPEAGCAGLGIAPVADGAYLFTNGAGKAPRYINRDGVELFAFDTAEVAGTSINYFEVETLSASTRRFLSIANGFTVGTQVVELLGTPGDDLCAMYELFPWTPIYAANGNANATAQSVYISKNNFLAELTTNNGLSIYSMNKVVPDFVLYEPQVLLSADQLDFGRTALRTMPTLTLGVANIGTADLEISSVGSSSRAFSVSVDTTRVGPGEEATISVVFMPGQEGDFNEVLTINTNAGDFTVDLLAAVYELWPQEWLILAEQNDWFGINHMVRSVAYSKATNHLYVVSRVGGSFIKVFDAATGEFIKDLDNTGISGGTYHINLVTATEDGQIFVGNLALANVNFKLYRFADEEAAPELVFDGLLEGRTGDALAATGTGDAVTVFVSGSGNEKIFALVPAEGGGFERADDIVLPDAGCAGLGIAPVDGGAYLFTNGAGKAPRYIKRDGTDLFAFDTAEAAGTSITYFQVETEDMEIRQFVGIVNGWGPGMQVVELLGPTGDELCNDYTLLPARTLPYAAVSNANATGQAVYNSVNNSLVELITNNGMASYDFSQVVPNPLVPTGIILGKVIAAATGLPIANAELTLQETGFATVTDDQGEYAITDVPAGNYELSVRARDYFAASQNVAVPPDSFVVADFALELRTWPAMSFSAYPVGPQAKLEWTLERPNVNVSYHSGTPSSGWYQKQNRAYGVVFDLSDYSGATLEQVDFCHYAWQVLHGPYNYRVHVLNWQDSTLVLSFDQITARDSYDQPEWELAIDLGGIPAMEQVGIFIEPLSGSLDDAHPALSTDDLVPAVKGANFIIMDVNDPFGTVQDVNDINDGMGNFLLDLWIDTPSGQQVKAAKLADRRPATESLPAPTERGRVESTQARGKPDDNRIDGLKGFYIYRGSDVEDLELLAGVPASETAFIDESPWEDSTYVYAISAVYDVGESEKAMLDYYHPLFLDIDQARIDANGDYVPDRLGDMVTIRTIVTTPNYNTGSQSNYYMQDETAGINFFCRNVNFGELLGLTIGDEIYVTGKIDHYRGLTEIVADFPYHVTLLSRENAIPDTARVAIAEIGEELEAQLVTLDGVTLVDPENWPAAGSNATVYITDGADTLALFIDKDTDLAGWTPPTGLFKVTGVIDQYTRNIPPNDGYEIRPRSQADFTFATSVVDKETLPLTFELGQNYPNPFNPETSIRLQLPQDAEVHLAIYNLLGKQVAEIHRGKLAAGVHDFTFQATALPSGTYFYHVQADEFNAVKKMVLLK
ncbi:DUF4623 domain-containing protein [candidate division KSB1 bacterium]|nr:DUF4623 domain-containing protein [candidate division KSB1 bacterium]